MKDYFLRRVSHVVVAAFLAMVSFAGVSVASAAEPKLDDKWHFTLIPYVWLPSVDGEMNVDHSGGIGSSNIDIGSSSYMDNLQFAAMFSLEVEKGRWSLLSDFAYVDFSDDSREATFKRFPGVEIDGETKLEAMIFEIAGAYSLYRSERARFDVLGGIRYIGIDGKVSYDVSTPLPFNLPSRSFSDDVDYVDPIIGFKGRFELGKHWFVPYYADIGGFGINDEFNWQAFGGIGYHFSELFSMVLGYRHLEYDFHDDKLIKDLSLSGGQLGFVFRF